MRTRPHPRTGGAVVLALAALLPACAPSEHLRTQGEFATRTGGPFTLTQGTRKLVLTPGHLTITPIEETAFHPPQLILQSGTDRLVIDLHRGELTRDGLNIIGVTHGLSANLQGTWRDHPIAQRYAYTTESCSTYGWCAKERTEKVCDDRNCRNEKRTEWGQWSDCPGTREVRIDYQDYEREYRIRFINPMNTRDEPARYQGVTGVLTRETGRSGGPCYPD